MPIYEYECRTCHEQFEKLVRPGDRIQCSSCHGEDLQRLQSLFAVSSRDLSRQHVKQAKTQVANTHREQSHAEMEALLHHDD